MLTYFTINESGDLDVYENFDVNIHDTELPEEHDLYVFIPENPGDPITIYYQNNFYNTNSLEFILDTNNDEASIYPDKNREYSLSPQKTINSGPIKSVLRRTTLRCRRGYHLVCGRDENNQRHCWCQRN